MIRRLGLAGLLAAALLPAAVFAQPVGPIPADLAKAMTDWGICRGQVMSPLFADHDTPEQVADLALQGCVGAQDRANALAVQHYGPTGADLIKRAAATARTQMIDTVNHRRSGTPISDPAGAWGECLGNQTKQHAASALSAEAVTDQAFAQCVDLERKVLQSLEAQTSHDQATTMIGQIRTLFRAKVIELIDQTRARAH